MARYEIKVDDDDIRVLTDNGTPWVSEFDWVSEADDIGPDQMIVARLNDYEDRIKTLVEALAERDQLIRTLEAQVAEAAIVIASLQERLQAEALIITTSNETTGKPVVNTGGQDKGTV